MNTSLHGTMCDNRESDGDLPGAWRTPRLRVALYSHDTMGLGHVRRNLLIAQTLACSPLQPVTLMVSGAYQASAYPMPPGTDMMILPSLLKEMDGQYHPRCLNISLQELISLRSQTICAALETFAPDVLIVDNVPRGAAGELDQALECLRARGRTRCVLGLRDVLDDPAAVREEWRRTANEDTIRAFYDAVWVYGDPAVYDPVRAYGFSADVAAKVRCTGYLDQCARFTSAADDDADPMATLGLPPGQFVLCLVGGGQDGAFLAEAFAQADLPAGIHAVILTGPHMPPEAQQRLYRRAATNPRLTVLEFVAEPTRLLSHAHRVIAMGGYNTTCEVLSFEKRALIVPRVKPRREQIIRTERLRDLGLLDMLHPDAVSPDALTGWLSRDLEPPSRVRERINLNGLARLPYLLAEVLDAQAHGAE